MIRDIPTRDREQNIVANHRIFSAVDQEYRQSFDGGSAAESYRVLFHASHAAER